MSSHEPLAAYVLGRLDDAERAAFEAHLAGCERCRTEADELRAVADLLAGATPAPLPAGLEARTLAAVAAQPVPPPGAEEEDAAPLASVTPIRRRVPRGAAIALAAAAGLVLAFVLGSSTSSDTTRTQTVARTGTVTVAATPVLPGDEEKRATLRGDGFTATAQVNVTGPGRVVGVKSRTVPKIPKGTYYELWFVGPGDAPASPNRISAGTWHPNTLGVTDVRFLIAADPAKFPDIEVTREPPDGDPRPSGRVVLTSR